MCHFIFPNLLCPCEKITTCPRRHEGTTVVPGTGLRHRMSPADGLLARFAIPCPAALARSGSSGLASPYCEFYEESFRDMAICGVSCRPCLYSCVEGQRGEVKTEGERTEK